MLTFIQSAGIVLREGLETLLIVGAIATYLRSQNITNFLPSLFLGVALALAVLAPVVLALGHIDALTEKAALQGAILLIAALTMLYVSGWLFAHRSGAHWRGFLQRRVRIGLARRDGYAFAAVAFIAVFREGAEIILLLNAVAIKNQGWQSQIFAGIAIALILLGLIAIIAFKARYRLPLRLLFLITSALLFVMGMTLLGDAVRHFQGLEYISTTPILPAVALLERLGFNGSYEALVVQVSLLVLTAYGMISAAVEARAPMMDR